MFDEDVLGDIKNNLRTWEKEEANEFRGERKAKFPSESGIEMERLYTPLDIENKGIDYLEDIGFPGMYPFTRGTTATGYRGHLWEIQQYSGHATAEVCNKLWKTLIAAGAHNLSIAYDLPTQLGYDPDHPLAEGEVGRVGISMTSLRDWEMSFQGINLDGLFVSQVLNASAAVGLASLICLGEQKGIGKRSLRGAVQNDILKEYQARGCYIFPPEPSLRLAIDIAIYCSQNMPLFRGISVATYHHSERGAAPIHEAAIGLANCIAYFKNVLARGVEIDSIAPTMRFIVGIDHRSFFEHIAKIRAMRKIYARIVKEKFGAKKPESMMCYIYAGKRGSTLYRQQYLNNITRSTIAGMAAVFANCQSIGLRSYDECFGIPSEDAILTSTRAQQIIGHETGIVDTVDPLAGSYFIEWLTKELEEKISEEVDRIERLGGALQCTMTGYFHKLIATDAYEWQKTVENGETKIVGVNCFLGDKDEERPSTVYRANPKTEADRIAAVQELRLNRDNEAVWKALENIKVVASETGPKATNLVPPVIEAVKSYCTVGEVCNALRQVWGEYKGFGPSV